MSAEYRDTTIEERVDSLENQLKDLLAEKEWSEPKKIIDLIQTADVDVLTGMIMAIYCKGCQDIYTENESGFDHFDEVKTWLLSVPGDIWIDVEPKNITLRPAEKDHDTK